TRKMHQRALVAYDGRKLIIGGNSENERVSSEDPTQNVVGLFNSRKDPWEETPLSSPEDLVEMQEEYSKLLGAIKKLSLGARSGGTGVSDETLKQLESLGYLK